MTGRSVDGYLKHRRARGRTTNPFGFWSELGRRWQARLARYRQRRAEAEKAAQHLARSIFQRITAAIGFAVNSLSWMVMLGAVVGLAFLSLSLEGLTTYLRDYVGPPLWAAQAEHLHPNYAVDIVGMNGVHLGSLGLDDSRRDPIVVVPQTFSDLLMAFEDARFYEHHGVDQVRLLGAVARTMHGQLEGGSTLTMQLAKMMKGDTARTIRRKLDDMALALAMEKHLSKEQILKLYADYAYFGHNVYGLKNACEFYFARQGCEGLSLEEAAYLVGLVKAPSKYAGDPELGKARRDVVLSVALGPPPAPAGSKAFLRWYLSGGYAELWQREFQHKDLLENKYGRAAIEAALKTPLKFAYVRGTNEAPYVRDAAIALVESKLGQDRMTRGADVRLTINGTAQQLAEQALASALKTAKSNGADADLDGGVVVLNAQTGDVRALVGGADYTESQVPFALRPIQVGSAVKPLVYAEAFEEKIVKPGERVLDARICIGSWCPKNYGNKYYGSLPVEDALSHSLNSVAVRLASKIGAETLYERFRELGFRSALQPNLTLALGASEVTMLELAQAYTALLDGAVKPARLLVEAGDRAGGVLYKEPPSEAVRVYSPQSVANVREAMRRVLLPGGTGVRLGAGLAEGWKNRGLDMPPQMACKTGTTNDSLRVGMMCLVSDSDLHEPLIVAVYMGYQRPRPLGEEATGGRLAGPAMQKVVLGMTETRQGYTTFAAANHKGPFDAPTRAPLLPMVVDKIPSPPIVYETSGATYLRDLYDLGMPPKAWSELKDPLTLSHESSEKFTEKLRGEEWKSGNGPQRAVLMAKKLIRFVALRGFGRGEVAHRTLVPQRGGFAVVDEQPDRIVTDHFTARADIKRLRAFVSDGVLTGLDLITDNGAAGESYVRLHGVLRRVQAAHVHVDKGSLLAGFNHAGLDDHDLSQFRELTAGTSINVDAIRRGFDATLLMAGKNLLAADIKAPMYSGEIEHIALAHLPQGVFDPSGNMTGARLWPIVADESDVFSIKHGDKRTRSDAVFRTAEGRAVVSPTRARLLEVDDDAHRIILKSAAGHVFSVAGVQTRLVAGDWVLGHDVIGRVDARGYVIVRAEDGLASVVTAADDTPHTFARAFVSQYLRQLNFVQSGPTRKQDGNAFASLR